jgi:type VI secretion system protein ImpH
MAGEGGMSPDDLTPADLPSPAHQASSHFALDLLQANPYGFGLFAALRVLEQSSARQPRLGESRKASDDIVRLGQAPHLSFAPSDVALATTHDDGRFHLEQYGFGVFGPNGALPLHLTELAYERRRHKEDGTVVDFLNLFQHRLISLFYRAWANSEPAVSLDRPETDRFRAYVGALIGLAPDSAHDADAVPDYAKLYRAGRFAQQTRSADGLEAVLVDYFGVPVEVRQFAGAWFDIPADLHCRLGEQQLGISTTLGASTWQCQHKFEIVLGPLPRVDFSNFLPGAAGLTELHSLVRLYTNDEWAWQVRLLLRDVDIPGTRLGSAGPARHDVGDCAEGGASRAGNQLGWTSWLSSRRAGAEDVVIQDIRVPAAPNSVTSGARHNG